MTVHTVLDTINSLPPEVWETAVSALFLSPVMLGVKKWLDIHVELVMTLYVIGGAFVTAALAYVQNTPSFAPWLIIPLQGLVTFAVSQPIYFAIVKPLRNKFRSMLAEANSLNEAKRSAAVPADGIKLNLPTTDFK